MFHRKSFQNLLNVSQHPVLRNHVHTILYEFRFLADVDRVEYEYNIQNHESFENHGPEEKTLLLEEGWKTYNKLLVEQDYMRTTQRDIVTFTQALPRFTMLKRLEMRTVHGMRDVYGLPHSASMVEAYAATLADEGMMLSTGEFDSQELGFRALTALLLGATGMKEKLESLVVSNVHWSFFGETPAGMNYYRSVFAGLKDVHLALVSDYDDQEEEDIVVLRHKELGLALSAATALESLRLDLGGDGDLEPTTAVMLRRMQVPIMLENIVQDKIWEKLRIIELCFVTSTVRCLLEFIRRHSSTLKSVKWSNMWLTECTEGSGWFQIFTALRDACLDVVEFRGTWGCEGQVEGHQRRPKLLNMAERGKEISMSYFPSWFMVLGELSS